MIGSIDMNIVDIATAASKMSLLDCQPSLTSAARYKETSMHIEDVCRSISPIAGQPGLFHAEVDASWAQGRTLFGGIQALLAVRAMRTAMPDLAPLWSLHTTFVAPAAPGQLTLQVEVLRQGRSAVQMAARLLAGDQVAAMFVAVFGASRDSALSLRPAARPLADGVSGGPELPFIPGMSPEFTRHYAYRWVEGGLPFSGHTQPANRILLRQRDPGLMGEEQIVAMADAIPPVALSMVQGHAPASTISWELEFVHHGQSVDNEGWWRMDASLVAARDGYANQDAHLHAPDGELVALSRQVVAVFA